MAVQIRRGKGEDAVRSNKKIYGLPMRMCKEGTRQDRSRVFGHSEADQLRYGVGIAAMVEGGRDEDFSAQGNWADLLDCSGATRGRSDG